MSLMSSTQKLSQAGITLIELLVVIAIVSMLSAVVTYSTNPTEKINMAKDSAVLNAIGQCANALEVWHVRHYPNYPDALDEMVPMKDLKIVPAQCQYYGKATDNSDAWVAGTLLANHEMYGCATMNTLVHWCYQTITGTAGYICDNAGIFETSISDLPTCAAIATQAGGEWLPKR